MLLLLYSGNQVVIPTNKLKLLTLIFAAIEKVIFLSAGRGVAFLCGIAMSKPVIQNF